MTQLTRKSQLTSGTAMPRHTKADSEFGLYHPDMPKDLLIHSLAELSTIRDSMRSALPTQDGLTVDNTSATRAPRIMKTVPRSKILHKKRKGMSMKARMLSTPRVKTEGMNSQLTMLVADTIYHQLTMLMKICR